MLLICESVTSDSRQLCSQRDRLDRDTLRSVGTNYRYSLPHPLLRSDAVFVFSALLRRLSAFDLVILI